MRKPLATKAQIAAVAESFRDELARLHQQMGWPKYKDSRLHLIVTFGETPKWEIQCNPGSTYGETIKGSDLEIVMDEVYRRLGYQDREEARIASSMRALTDDRHNIDGIATTPRADDITF